ncbi:hypothetical protein ACFXTI_040154 [Malus domestica]
MAYQISNRKSSGQESNDRSRTSGANTRPRQSHRTIYEDFQPHFELMEEQEAHIVQVHLPGFVKEQAKIKFMQNPSVIRVYGQRPLGDNKWSRFNQTFPVQQNCDASKIHGKFSNGILTITIPKKVITWTATAKPIKEPPPKTAATTAEPKTHKVQDDLIPSKPSLTTSAGPPKTAIIPKIAASAQGEQQGGKTSAQEVSVAAASKAEKASFTTRDEKEMVNKNGRPPLAHPKGTAAETEARKDKEDDALPKPISSIQKEKERDEKRLIPLTSPETSKAETKSEEGGQDGKRGKASVESVYRTGVENKDQKKAKGKAEDEGSIAAHVMAAANERMKHLGSRMNDEEKKILINMGATILVFIALGASASYNMWSSGKGKN